MASEARPVTFTAPCPGCGEEATWGVIEPSAHLQAAEGRVVSFLRVSAIVCPRCTSEQDAGAGG